jgi:hypothetical protein
VRRQTTPGPGGLTDKGTKGKYARKVPIIEEIRPMVIERLDSASGPDMRLFTGPRGGRISTAVLRDATHWDEVVTALGYEHLRRLSTPCCRSPRAGAAAAQGVALGAVMARTAASTPRMCAAASMRARSLSRSAIA